MPRNDQENRRESRDGRRIDLSLDNRMGQLSL